MTLCLVFLRRLALLFLAALAACSSDKADPTPEPARGLSWTVDGVAASTTTVQSQKSSATFSVSGTVNPGNLSSSYVSLEIPNAVGTYVFGPSSAGSAVYSTSAGARAVYYAGATGAGTVTGGGTIVVTALSAAAATGTFTFTGINPNTGAAKSISNGTFNVGL